MKVLTNRKKSAVPTTAAVEKPAPAMQIISTGPTTMEVLRSIKKQNKAFTTLTDKSVILVFLEVKQLIDLTS